MTVLAAEDVKKLVLEGLPDWIEEQPELRRRLRETIGEIPAQPLRQAQGRPSPKMTYEEFLAWADEDTWAEWVDGEVIMLSPASPEHQDLSDFLVAILRPYVETRGLGKIISAPFAMRLEHGREPDLLFVAAEHLDRLYSGGLQGPADMAIEVISKDSLERDRGAKFVEYEAAGIQEYWLIDPLRERSEFYRLDAEGRYEIIFAGREGVYRSEVLPGFWLRVEWLWQEPLPHPLRVLGEIAGVDTEVVERFLRALGGEG